LLMRRAYALLILVVELLIVLLISGRGLFPTIYYAIPDTLRYVIYALIAGSTIYVALKTETPRRG